MTVHTVKSGTSEVENLSLLDNPTSASKEQIQPYKKTIEITASPNSTKRCVTSLPPSSNVATRSPISNRKKFLSTTESLNKLGARDKKAVVIASFKNKKKKESSGGEAS
eukprot:CAMPEP_0170487806 /NCGR_PEP_ID=MMETSP0208-20121228/6539_1 /TAXON_ID=197538 /ORGANISM="Strombidium inclinatum, Strain S3" /LENGTH=108 /DNA_ID=CAMNT_0010762209 /DNA_START=190 /DNA_END=516 /DNA_ORIENTATION=-